MRTGPGWKGYSRPIPASEPMTHHPTYGTIHAWRARLRAAVALLMGALVAGCGPKRLAVIAPMPDPAVRAHELERRTVLVEPIQIRFSWHLNEAGARMQGLGVARVEPPYRARLDLFLDNGETVLSAALVDDELRLPYGARQDFLPPIGLMWGTLGVFRPLGGAELEGGERLEGGAQRLRYRDADTELHYEVAGGMLRGVELMDGEDVLQWVRVEPADDGRYPAEAIYRNLVEYRELRIDRESLERRASPFDPEIWDPRRPAEEQ